MQHLNKLYQSTGISNLQDLALLLQPSSLFLHRVIPLEHFIQNVAMGVTKKKNDCVYISPFLKPNKATAFDFASPERPSLLSSQIAPTK